jgi:glucosamine kinase
MSDLARGVAIGIDAGGAKTLGILVDAGGNEVARANASGANPWDVGPEAARSALASVLHALLAGGGVRAIAIGNAGVDREPEREAAEANLRPLIPAGVRFAVYNDAAAALSAVGRARPAMVVIADSGSIAYGETADGKVVRVGGHGAILGDDGSLSAFGLGAVRHVAHALDGCETRGLLAEAVIEKLELRRSLDIVERILHPQLDVPLVASLALLVEQAYHGGDKAAMHLVEIEGNALATSAKRVARIVRGKDDLPVLLIGGVFTGFPEIRKRVIAGLRQTGPIALSESSECVHGAARLALELAT